MWYVVSLVALCLSLTPLPAIAAPSLVVDDMENLAAWRTGGQKEATLAPERGTLREGKQALRFDVAIDHRSDETIHGKQYPKGWPRVERNPSPPLDLSGVGFLAFDVYALSSRPALPGSALHVILRDESGAAWSANLGQLPLKQWKPFHLGLGSFRRDRILHWQFFLSESDYEHGDTVSFVIDNVRGVAAQRYRETAPRLRTRFALLAGLAGPKPPPGLAGTRAEMASIEARVRSADRLGLAASNALDREIEALTARANDLILLAGAAATSDGSYCVGVETSLRKIHRDDREFSPGRQMRLALAANEREAAQIVVRAMTADIPRLRAEVTDLAGPAGAKIPRARVQVHAVGYVEMLKASYATERDGWWPDPLIPLDWPGSGKKGLGPLADAFARKGETQPLWVSVFCPAGTPAGEYRGSITLKPEGLPAARVALSVKVRNYGLPLRPRLKTAFSFSENDVARFNKVKALTTEQRLACEAFLLERKMNPMLLYTPYAWPGLEDVPFMAQRGLNAYCLGYAPSTVEDVGNRVYYRWLRDQRAWLAARGLDRDAWLYGYDEPHCRPDWETLKGVMRDTYALLQAAAPGMPRASTTAIVPELFGAGNLWLPQPMQLSLPDTLGRWKAGDQVWTYVACTPPHPFANIFVEYPALESRLLFWQTWQHRCTGFLYYATSLWRPNYEGTEQRWPEIPWNPRPEKDFQFNGDGILLYPGPNATLLSSIRQEVITDGVEDYDLLCLLRDATAELKRRSPKSPLVPRAQALLEVPRSMSAALTEFSHDPALLLNQRERAAAMLEQVRAALPAQAWQKALRAEPPLSPPAPKEPAVAVLPTPYRCNFEGTEGMRPWVSGIAGESAERAVAAGASGKCAVSRGRGKGWADWESPYLRVDAGRRYALRLAANADAKAGLVRVFLFKYDKARTPLDRPDRALGAFSPALLGVIERTGEWEKHRYLKGIEPGVALVRVYLQCFGVDGAVAFDDVSLTEAPADPSLVDDCDEVGAWTPAYPESGLTRETATVHQGDGALKYTVTVDHKGGEEKYPIGWPHLHWNPMPPLDWSGRQSLTFWVFATSSRKVLPARAVNISLRSANGASFALPLTFPLNVWQQVSVPLAGKNLSAVNHIQFFVEEAAYQHGDRVTFLIDDLRVQ